MVLNTLLIKLLPTNNEDIDNDGFWNHLSYTRERMGSNRAAVKFANPKDGLNSNEVYDQCKAATSMANSYIKLNGHGDHGETLKGNNDDFNLSIEADDLNKNVTIAGPALIDSFLHLVHSGAIQVPQITDKINSKIQDIFNRFF